MVDRFQRIFLAENVMRRNLSWRDKAKLIEYDYETNEL